MPVPHKLDFKQASDKEEILSLVPPAKPVCSCRLIISTEDAGASIITMTMRVFVPLVMTHSARNVQVWVQFAMGVSNMLTRIPMGCAHAGKTTMRRMDSA